MTHHYDFVGDKLIIGKFCEIASGVEFVMNGANHQMNAVSAFLFYTLEGRDMSSPAAEDIPLKGSPIIWIDQNAVILLVMKIGDGAIMGTNSIVGCDVEPYTIVIGNPAHTLRKRFDDELIKLMLQFKQWDKSIEEINNLIPILTSSNLEDVKAKISQTLKIIV